MARTRVAGNRGAVVRTGARTVVPGNGGAGSARRTGDVRPIVRTAAPSDVAAVVAVSLGRLAAIHARCLTAISLRSLAAIHARGLAAIDLGCLAAAHARCLAAAGLGRLTTVHTRRLAAADAAVVVAAGRRHLGGRPAVPRWGAVLRPRRVGRTTAGTTTLALCLKRGGTHHYDAKHQYHFYKSFHLKNGVFACWLKAKKRKRENRANHNSIQRIEGSRAHHVSCFLA